MSTPYDEFRAANASPVRATAQLALSLAAPARDIYDRRPWSREASLDAAHRTAERPGETFTVEQREMVESAFDIVYQQWSSGE